MIRVRSRWIFIVLVVASGVAGIAIQRYMDFRSRHQVIQLGTLLSDQDEVLHTVRFRNWNWRTIQLRDPRTSCGCTVPGIATRTLRPFQATEIPIEIAVNTSKPRIRSLITFAVSDSDERIELELVGEVERLMPDHVYTARAVGGQSSVGQFILRAPDTDILKVFSVSQTPELFGVRFENVGGDQTRTRVVLDLKKGIAPGPFKSVLRFKSTSPQVDTNTISVSGIVMGPVELERESLSLGYMMKGDATENSLRIYSPSGKTFRVTQVACSNAGIHCNVRQEESTVGVLTVQADTKNLEYGSLAANCDVKCLVDNETFTLPLAVRGYVIERVAKEIDQ